MKHRGEPLRFRRMDHLIGHTPIVKLQNVGHKDMAEVWVKLEGQNPAGSIKDRTALGMIEDAEDMVYVERTFDAMRAPDGLGLILLIETPAGVLNLQDIVKASPRTNGLIAGGLDYAMTTHSLSILLMAKSGAASRLDNDLLFMRQKVLAVARACDLSAIDAMRPGELTALSPFRADAEYSRWLGFDGLDFYHPAYIDIANEVFTPSDEELDWANKVLASNQGTNSAEAASRKVDGRVILPQHRAIARRLRDLADEIVKGQAREIQR